MNRPLDGLLQAGLALTSLVAMAYSVRALFGIVTFGVNWNYGGLIAAYCGPPAFGLALFLNSQTATRETAKTDYTNA